MFLCGKLPFSLQTLIKVLIVWNVIILTASLMFTTFALNVGHHGPESVHEGDEFKELDFGIYQLATTIDRREVKTNLITTLTYFGDHVLHHMFPSLDHSLLPHLKQTFIETCTEFQEEFRECSLLEAFIGQFQQLSRTETIKLNNNQ